VDPPPDFVFQEVTWKDALGVELVERVVHEAAVGRGLVPAQLVVHDEGVQAVVDVRGLVEEEAAVLLRAVAGVGDELRVRVGALLQLVAVVAPRDGRLGVAVHHEGEAPVVLLHGVAQVTDSHRD